MIEPLKSGGDVREDWRTTNQLIESVQDINRVLGFTASKQGRRQMYGGGRAVPFQIRAGSDWLKVQVGTGYIITTGDPITPSGLNADIALSSGVSRYWLYLDITSTTAAVAASATTLAWATDKVPVGWVDTNTYSANSLSVINQFLHDNLFLPCL